MKLTKEQREEFDHMAYNYRSWPMRDPVGVVASFEELLVHVEALMDCAVEHEKGIS